MREYYYTITGSDDGLPPVQCQAIIWTNDGLLSIRPLGTNFSFIKIENYSSKKKFWKCRLQTGAICLGHEVVKL